MASQQHIQETVITTNNEDNQTHNISVKQEIDLTYGNIIVKIENEDQDETEQQDPFNDIEVHVGDDDTCPEDQKGMYARPIKQESVLPVTENHLISNTAPTNTSPLDSESQTRKTLIIEILPMTDGNLSQIGIPEETLPANNTYFNNDDKFQLNSITGNMFSLEQEANRLLKAKRKKSRDPKSMLKCPKCPKSYRYMPPLLRHLDVHESIEKRKMGIVKGVKTRAENRKKKLNKPVKVEFKDEKVKKEGYECTCGNVYRTRSRMETCLSSHKLISDTDSNLCVNCKKQIKSKALHRKRLPKIQCSCKFCQIDYKTGKELFEHLQAHRQVQVAEFKFVSEVVDGKQKLECFICSGSYSELPELLRHCLKDHNDLYTCQKCKKTFSTVVELVNHMKATHPNFEGQSFLDLLEAFAKLVSTWKCDDCNIQFYEADKLVLHKIQEHRAEANLQSQFQCTGCHTVFTN